MKHFEHLLRRLEQDSDRAGELPVLLGFDGTIDRLYSVVRSREGLGEAFQAFPEIADFGQATTALAGKSGMMELWPKREKIGGNGPISALALAANSRRVSYIGPLGKPLNPAFSELEKSAESIISIGSPAVTHAREFNDGKIMLPVLKSYEAISAECLLQQVGLEKLKEMAGTSKLICLLNWTCLPGMNSIYELFVDSILPEVMPDPDRLFFFDLADPAKHSAERLCEAVSAIAGFAAFGKPVLGLNFSEAIQLSQAFGLPAPDCDDASLKETALGLREASGLHTVMIHPVDRAACASPDGAWCVQGPVCDAPVITTGAGDHLNAGFCLGLLLGWSHEDSLCLGVLFSGYYVRSAKSPSLIDIRAFISDNLI